MVLNSSFHQPVMVKEVLKFLNPRSGDTIIDGTLGGGGHAAAILAKIGPRGHLIGIDLDPEAIESSRQHLASFSEQLTLIQDHFANLKKIIQGINPSTSLDGSTSLTTRDKSLGVKVKGILFDLGLSSHQLDTPRRGFSLRKDGPLDMRFDQTLSGEDQVTAARIVNTFSAEGLSNIFKEYGEERFARSITKAILEYRRIKPFTRTRELLNTVKSAVPWVDERKKLDAATRIFQALRMAVNNERQNLQRGLAEALAILTPKGRMVVISYHSGEDRLVKEFFNREAKDCLCPPEVPRCVCGHKKRLRLLTKKPVIAGRSEIARNPRSRSAKLRAAEKC